MLSAIPRLEDYNVSPVHGFLPTEAPLQCLPHPVYDRWERIMNNFQSLLLSKRLRIVINNLPVLPAVHLNSEPEWRRAYLMLCFMAHGYIWGGEKPAERLPPSITYPLFQVCEHLEMPPVATFAAVCLWNWKPIFLADEMSLDNISTLATFTGSLDESWFYLVSVAIEAKGGAAIPVMLDAIQAAREDDIETVTRHLRSFAEILDDVASLLVRMYENCDPHVFYYRIRPYLAGSKNMRDAGLPRGVFYDDGGPNSRWRQYGGGSNAQSSLIQFFDIVLGVEHRPMGEGKDATSESDVDAGQPRNPHSNFIHDMRRYMPGPHRRFLEAVEAVANIRDYVELHPRDRDLTVAYDACLAMLRALRDKHIQMVSRYIIVKSHGVRPQSEFPAAAKDTPDHTNTLTPDVNNDSPNGRVIQRGAFQDKGLASVSSAPVRAGEKPKKMRGTGGSTLLPLLKQARDETGEASIDDWVKRVSKSHQRVESEAKVLFRHHLTAQALDTTHSQLVDALRTWVLEEDGGGGICAY